MGLGVHGSMFLSYVGSVTCALSHRIAIRAVMTPENTGIAAWETKLSSEQHQMPKVMV